MHLIFPVVVTKYLSVDESSNVSQVYKNFEKATKYKNFKEMYNLIKKEKWHQIFH